MSSEFHQAPSNVTISLNITRFNCNGTFSSSTIENNRKTLVFSSATSQTTTKDRRREFKSTHQNLQNKVFIRIKITSKLNFKKIKKFESRREANFKKIRIHLSVYWSVFTTVNSLKIIVSVKTLYTSFKGHQLHFLIQIYFTYSVF